MDQLGFHYILILLATAVALVVLFRYLRLPQVLAYLCAGIAVGPHGLAWIPDLQGTRYLAEFGLVFLMFSIGIEFSLPQLVAMRRTVFGLGGLQVLVSCLVFGALAYALGVSVEGAIVIGGVLALSSTAISMRLLVEQLEHHSRHGRRAFGILLFQDIAVVPFLILIPALAGGAELSIWTLLGASALKGVLVLVIILLAGRWLLRPLFHEVALARSREFFMLTVLLVTLSAAWITQAAGLSPALGAFFAGLMIAETEYRHQVEGDILPFRDVLMGLFFITVGMLLDLKVVWALWPWVLGATAVVMIFKTGLIVVLSRTFGSETGVALRTGLVLAAGGEFGFALLVQAGHFNILTGTAPQVVLATVLLSMLCGTLLIRHNGWLARRLVPSYQERRESNLDIIRAEAGAAQGHVIISGYGRSGQNLAWMLKQEEITSVALDLDPVRVRDARDAGEAVVYGDAVRRDVLLAAGLMQARALAISFADTPSALRMLEVVRGLRPDLPVVVRTKDDHDLEQLRAAGATEVVAESLEGSLMMGSHVLVSLGVPMTRVIKQLRAVHKDRYRMLRGIFRGEESESSEEADAGQERLHSVTLLSEAHAVGRRLADLHLDDAGVVVTAVRRGGIRGPQPVADTKFKAGDVLVLYGAPDALDEAEKILLQG
jgi:CPA2 family monovalent cation:H+ antiporter-2